MFSLLDRPTRLCDGITRREWLRVGGLGVAGASINALAAGQAAGGAPRPAKRCIVLFLLGGPPQHETWDPKPDAPAEVRGEFQSIATSVPGLRVGELMPLTARLAHRVAVLRAMSTDDNAHSSSGYWMLTGRPHTPTNRENAKPGAPNDWPCVAAVVRHLRGDRGNLPGAIRLPEEIWNTGRIVWPGQTSGWLGAAADPWLIDCDPNASDFHVPDLALPSTLPPLRLQRRRRLLDEVNHHLQRMDSAATGRRWSGLQHQALNLLSSPKSREAFDLDLESPAMRDRYGRNRFGQSVLLARRLIEADVSLVQVNWTRWKDDPTVAPAWDTHAQHSQRLKEALMPPLDQAYSALLEDLAERGLLDDTLVVWMGEFGRTPKFNGRGGRDHWGHVFSAALAGGGVQGGSVWGESDAHGAYPQAGRVEPQDLTATIFHCLGYDPHTQIHDAFGRPLAISQGRVLHEILA